LCSRKDPRLHCSGSAEFVWTALIDWRARPWIATIDSSAMRCLSLER
jgi:hypothetical protein